MIVHLSPLPSLQLHILINLMHSKKQFNHRIKWNVYVKKQNCHEILSLTYLAVHFFKL